MCDTMVRVLDDRVLFAKNSDRDPNEAQLLDWQPARDHAADATVRCTWIEIPQVPHTHAVLLSRPFWMWGAEMGTNEHGVVIGNEAVFTSEPYAKTGLTGMDLLRLALERAATAEEAVAVITRLLQEFGQGGGCGHEHRDFTYHNSFLVADHRHAWVLETAGDKWEVERVTSGARSISNGLTIPGFADRYADRLRGRVAQCHLRRELTEQGAGSAGSVLDLMNLLRTHADFEIDPTYSIVNGAMNGPCMHAGGLVAASQSTASWVSELRPTGASHWATATSAPCTSLFKPVAVDEPLDLGPAPTDMFDHDALWWRHERLHRRVLRDPHAVLPAYTVARDHVESAWAAQRPGSAAAFRSADDFLSTWTDRAVDEVTTDTRPWYVRRYWRIRDERAGVPDVASRSVA